MTERPLKGLYQYPFQSNFLQTKAGKLHYIDEGEGKVILCIHGNPTWSYFYRNVIASLREKYRVIALDNIGCGLSDKPQNYDYTLNNHIDNLQKLICHLKIEKYSLIMHDWGGAIGMGAAVQNPEKIEKVIIMNTAAFRSSRIPLRIAVCKLPFIGEFIVRGCNGFALPAVFMAVRKKMKKEIKEGFLYPYNNWQNRIATHRFVVDIPMKKSHRSYHRLAEIEERLPLFGEGERLLILWGGKDFCFNDSFYTKWREIFPKAGYSYFENAGHYLLEDESDAVIKEISQFLQKMDS